MSADTDLLDLVLPTVLRPQARGALLRQAVEQLPYELAAAVHERYLTGAGDDEPDPEVLRRCAEGLRALRSARSLAPPGQRRADTTSAVRLEAGARSAYRRG